MIEIQDEKTVYLIMNTYDKTEGRSPHYPDKVCDLKSTAIRLAKGKFVVGSDAPIEKAKAYLIQGQWYYPVSVERQTFEDEQAQAKINEKEQLVRKRGEALERAKALGLSAEDLRLLE